MSESIYGCMIVTEYFANLSKSIKVNHWRRFFNRFQTKWSASAMNDTMSFTTMSANVLKQPYKINTSTYIKGSLIGMCLDIIREKKQRRKRHSWFDAKLANEYGVSKPFNDNELLLKFTALTYPEVGDFLPFMLLELLYSIRNLLYKSGCYKIYCKIA
jgi:hypothetical protein